MSLDRHPPTGPAADKGRATEGRKGLGRGLASLRAEISGIRNPTLDLLMDSPVPQPEAADEAETTPKP